LIERSATRLRARADLFGDPVCLIAVHRLIIEEAEGNPDTGVMHFASAATHRLKIDIVENAWTTDLPIELGDHVHAPLMALQLATKVPAKSGRFGCVILEPLGGGAENAVDNVAFAAIHSIEFCVRKAAIGRCGVHAHETGPLVDQAALSI
jgi:hypothetical protein